MKITNTILSAALMALLFSCQSKSANPVPVQETHFMYLFDSTYFTPGETRIVKADQCNTKSVSVTAMPRGWTAIPDSQLNLLVSAPAEGAEAAYAGIVKVKISPVDMPEYDIMFRVDLVDPDYKSRPAAGFMGDSITEQWARPSFGGNLKFFTSNNFVNMGVGGETTADMKFRNYKLTAKRPHVYLILAGTNDLAQNDGRYVTDYELVGNIRTMCDEAVEAGCKVLVCSILPCKYYPWHPGILPAERIISLNEQLCSMAAEKGYAGYVDYHSSFAESDGGMISQLSQDGVHPNKAGFELMEKIVLPRIQELQ